MPPLIRHPALRPLPPGERPAAFREQGASRVVSGLVGGDGDALPDDVAGGEDDVASDDEAEPAAPALALHDHAIVPEMEIADEGFAFDFRFQCLVTDLRAAVDLIERQQRFKQVRFLNDVERVAERFLNLGKGMKELEDGARGTGNRPQMWKRPAGTLFYHEGVQDL
jgi:hypothetical protein